MDDKKHLVLPGETIATAEEFSPGEGAYESGGAILASTVGFVERDARNKTVSVRQLNPPPAPRRGDIVYGTITDIRNPIVTVEVFKMKGTRRGIAGDPLASLHISKLSQDYVEEIRTEMRVGDVIKAEVIQTRPSLQLTTANPNLGVVRAGCSKCRTVLERKGNGLFCPVCETTERRKTAKDYDEPPA